MGLLLALVPIPLVAHADEAPSNVDPALLTRETPAEAAEMHKPEVLSAKPSGFWTSNRPAVGGAYRYRLMGIGAIVLLITIGLTFLGLRRVGRRRAAAAS